MAIEVYHILLTLISLVVMLSDLWRYKIPDSANVAVFFLSALYQLQTNSEHWWFILLLYGGIAAFIAAIFVLIDDESDKSSLKNELKIYLPTALYFGVLVWVTPAAELWNPVYVMLAFFVAGLVLSLLGLMAGGDVKFLALCGLWLGYQPHTLLSFLIVMSVLGGAVVLLLMLARVLTDKFINESFAKKHFPESFLKEKARYVPYGVAIAGALIVTIYGLVNVGG